MNPTTHDELEAVFAPEAMPTLALGAMDLAWLVDEVGASSTICEPTQPIPLEPQGPGPVTIALQPFAPELASLEPPTAPAIPKPRPLVREVHERDALAGPEPDETPPAALATPPLVRTPPMTVTPPIVGRFVPPARPIRARPRLQAELRMLLVAAAALALGILLGALIPR